MQCDGAISMFVIIAVQHLAKRSSWQVAFVSVSESIALQIEVTLSREKKNLPSAPSRLNADFYQNVIGHYILFLAFSLFLSAHLSI